MAAIANYFKIIKTLYVYCMSNLDMTGLYLESIKNYRWHEKQRRNAVSSVNTQLHTSSYNLATEENGNLGWTIDTV